MMPFNRTLVVIVLVLAATFTQRAEAGRVGGPLLDYGTLLPGQSVTYDVTFAQGVQAAVAVNGNGLGDVDLYIYDGDGNITQGVGMYERRVATLNVYRGGSFRIEVRNNGVVPSSVFVGTN